MKYACHITERQTKSGVVFDARWRYINEDGFSKLTGSYGHDTRKSANAAYLEFLKTYVPPRKVATAPTKERLIFRDILPRYLESSKSVNTESTVYDKIGIFRSYISPTFENVELSKISKEMLYEWQDKLWSTVSQRTKKQLSYSQCEKVRGFLFSFLQWVEERYSIPNAMRSVKKPRRVSAKSEMQIWEVSAFNQFIDCVDDILWRTFFIVLFYTGVRVGECLALTDDKIGNGKITVNASIARKNLDGSTWKIKCTKNKKVRTNELLNVVSEQVEKYKAWKLENGIEGEFFFGGTAPMPEMRYQRALVKYCQMSGVKKIRIHDFRHSYVSMLIFYGASMPLVAALIGDTIEQVHETYGHLWKSERTLVLDKINAKIR